MEVDRQPDWSAFVDQLLVDWETQKPFFRGSPKTVFLGGGTPSRLPTHELARLLKGLSCRPATEVSMECNPEDIEPDHLNAWRESGLNRLSIGMQTLNEKFAQFLNRGCTAKHSARILGEVHSMNWPSWSVDLMFALPNQTMTDLEQDLHAVLASEVPHVSLYGLTWEPGTPFHRAKQEGRMTEVNDEEWRLQYDRIRDTLISAGFEQYEVSNFAKPGHRSIHNQLYWSDQAYMGLGPSAHGYRPNQERTRHKSDISSYMNSVEVSVEMPAAQQRAVDMLIGGLRSVEGIDLERLAQKTGLSPNPAAIEALRKEGFIEYSESVIRPTHDGFPISDAMVTHLANKLERVNGLGSH